MHRRRRRQQGANLVSDVVPGAANEVINDVILPQVQQGGTEAGGKEEQQSQEQVTNDNNNVPNHTCHARGNKSGAGTSVQMATLTQPGDSLGGLHPPCLPMGDGVTGSTKEQHQKHNKLLRRQKQASQPGTNYCSH
mmetsp:Transcript_24966/g.44966  ORF Transcript_24966/g.44966 Transcript_24966/m.44966 type:complete len:136 (-) Transcript_24966:75-482(-)